MGDLVSKGGQNRTRGLEKGTRQGDVEAVQISSRERSGRENRSIVWMEIIDWAKIRLLHPPLLNEGHCDRDQQSEIVTTVDSAGSKVLCKQLISFKVSTISL